MTFRRLTLGAITVGQLDGNGHPDVAIIYSYQPDGRFRCSAMQVSNTVLRAGGGNCFGDSGGPVFHGGFLVADTSFGASQFCRSSGGYYRLDTARRARLPRRLHRRAVGAPRALAGEALRNSL